MEEPFQLSFKLQVFSKINIQKFEEKLLEEATHVKDKIDEILFIRNGFHHSSKILDTSRD